MNMEQMGSAIIQPKDWMRREEMITPTLPRVSAKMCRNIPVCVWGCGDCVWEVCVRGGVCVCVGGGRRMCVGSVCWVGV